MLKDYSKWQINLQKYKMDVERDLPTCKEFIPNTWSLQLHLFPSTVKKRHYWFWSSGPDCGKTTFLENLDS